MAYPNITLTKRTANTTVINLTDLTGGRKGRDTLVGFDGTDWFRQDSRRLETKSQGNDQLRYNMFAETGFVPAQANYASSNLAIIQRGDENNTTDATLSQEWFANWWPLITAGHGVAINPQADNRKRTLVYRMKLNGHFQVKAHLSDDSFPDQILDFPDAGEIDAWWDASWVARSRNSELQITIRRMATTAGDGGICLLSAYIPPIGKWYAPRGFSV